MHELSIPRKRFPRIKHMNLIVTVLVEKEADIKPGDEIDLECLLEDTAELYARLSSASASSGLIVSQFTSV